MHVLRLVQLTVPVPFILGVLSAWAAHAQFTYGDFLSAAVCVCVCAASPIGENLVMQWDAASIAAFLPMWSGTPDG
ncbi:hypothetical protein Srufu_070470 [Streptomyces libani subsp. rufus]|nr:hypothetical protein Srufu_070470 [Streptomyces libani subsp. rufus]